MALLMMSGVCVEVETTRFFQVGFSYQASVEPPRATMSGFLSPFTSATST